MSARAESLAKQFEAKAAEMTGVIAKLSDADWKKITDGREVARGGHRASPRARARGRSWVS